MEEPSERASSDRSRSMGTSKELAGCVMETSPSRCALASIALMLLGALEDEDCFFDCEAEDTDGSAGRESERDGIAAVDG